MIAYIEGRFLEQTDNSAIVLTEGGIGYEIYLTNHALANLPNKGDVVSYFTVHVVREDAAELFGFTSFDERYTFLILTSISGVGARKALAILSTFSPDELRQNILDNNTMALAQVSGIGKKGAQQIFLDLQYKLQGSIGKGIEIASGLENKVLGETVAALINLGYSEEEIRPIAKEVLAENADFDVTAALRASLKQIAQLKAR